MATTTDTTGTYSTLTRGYALAAQFGLIITTTLLGVVLSRLLDADDLGLWFVMMSMATLVHGVMLGGAPPILVRRLATGAYDGASVVRSAVRCAGICTIVMTIALLWPIGPLLTANMAGDPPRYFIYLVIVLALLQAVQRFAAETLRGVHRIRAAVSLNGVYARGAALAVFVVLVVAGSDAGLAPVVIVQAVCTALVVTVVVAFFLVRRPGVLPIGSSSGGDDGSFTFAESWPLMLMSVLGLAVMQGDLVIGAIFLPSDEVASYGVALRAAALLLIPLYVVNSMAPPLMARELHHGTGRLQREVSRLSVPAGFASLAGCVLMIAFGRWGLRVAFGPEYVDAYPVLVVLAVSQLVNAAAGPCNYLLIAAGEDRLAARTSLLAVVTIVVAGSLLAWSHGMIGLAIGSAAGTILQNGVIWHLARRVTGVRTDRLVITRR